MQQMLKVDKYVQLSVKEGIQRHGQKAIDVVLTDSSQFNDKTIFKPRSIQHLTPGQNIKHSIS
jgi:hypothetical protein